jgi:hypothetical protein
MQRVLKQIIQEKTEAIDRGDDETAGQDCFLGVLIRLQKERSTAHRGHYRRFDVCKYPTLLDHYSHLN